MFSTKRAVIPLLWIVGLGIGGFVIYAWRSPIAPIDPPAAGSFGPQAIRRGSELAALGNCLTCHTAPGGDSFAGGRPLATPFGIIYSTNITPDVNTGIGHWSLPAFQRAMRKGVDREGSHLYPAFPYEHFTLLNDADITALYAFFMTRQPVQARSSENHLSFPLNLRFVLAGWKLLFFREGPYRNDAAHEEQWNRGAYLAEGVGHCGSCHTPRNSFGAEIGSQHLGGGEAEGWHAYAINQSSQSRAVWNADALHTFLRKGWHEQHGAAQGPMALVTEKLTAASESDVQAIAVYIASLTPGSSRRQSENAAATARTETDSRSNETGESIYAAACASCHDGTRALPFGGVKLTLSTAVTGESATNLIKVVLDGLHPPAGSSGPTMPGFASTLTDGQLESLVAYIRANIGTKPPWTGVESTVRQARESAQE